MKHLASTPAGKVAFCGVFAALAVVLMAMGTLLSVATFCAPMLASLLAIPVQSRCGSKYAWLWYCAVSILSLLLAPDREAALIFLLLGYCPMLRPAIHKLPKVLALLCKLALVNLASLLVFLILRLIGLPTVLSEFPNASGTALTVIVIAFLLCVNAVFFLYDTLLPRLTTRIPL